MAAIALLPAFWSPSLFVCADVDQKPIRCTVFHQKDFYAGKIDVVVAPHAVRMNIIDRNSYIVSHAPEWRVVMYNADSKNGMDMTLAKYLTHLPKWNPVESTTTLDGTGEKIGPIKYAGLDCIRYGHVFIRKGGTVDPDNRYGSEVYVAPNKEFPKEACQIDGKFCRDPSLPGIHVLVRVHAESAPKVSGQNLSSAMSTFFSRSLVLETKSVESKEFPASYFDYPAKIIKVGRECDVLNHMSVADQNELFDVLAK